MTDTYLTRKTLLRRLQSKSDELAWEEFVFYYQKFIYSIIIKMGINEADRSDLSQKVLLKIWKSIESFNYSQEKGHFRNWVNVIVRNTVITHINHYKHLNSKNEAILAVQSDYASIPEVDNVINSEWEKHVAAIAIENISQKVSADAMEAFLASLKNEPTNVTAERLALKENTIRVYKQRVKKKVMAEIQNLKEMLE